MDQMPEDNGVQAYIEQVLRGENRYYQEVTVNKVHGACPFGHREGETYIVTAMNTGGLCGALLKEIFAPVTVLHYGGGLLWAPRPDEFNGRCPEGGTVEVAVKRCVNRDAVCVRTACLHRDMTGRGYPALDRYRMVLEVFDIAGSCYWGHVAGDRIEIDPFNTGGACGLLYTQLYPYLHVLLSGATPPWALQEHSISGECPDVYNRLSFRLFCEERQDIKKT